MDLTQSKLTKSEWNNIEIPVIGMEKRILQLIVDGFDNVNISRNDNPSVFVATKLEYTPELEYYLFVTYMKPTVDEIIRLVTSSPNGICPSFTFKVSSSVSKRPLKTADQIRVQRLAQMLPNASVPPVSATCGNGHGHGNNNKQKSSKKTALPQTAAAIELLSPALLYMYEFFLLDQCQRMTMAPIGSTAQSVHLYTLLRVRHAGIAKVNQHVKTFVDRLVDAVRERLSVMEVLFNSYEFIEKNTALFQYEDMTLFPHQKELFSVIRNRPREPKLVLYIAPTGTGKTLSPIGLVGDGRFRVIFVCVARHVGLALAKSAISAGCKIAFAFGCETASDIRLHNSAAAVYSTNYKTGGIYKVDNSEGRKVELMICDVKSYITAMHYMLSFNAEERMILYWDEPTITMDYAEHDLHATIHRNWVENRIGKVVLSCATLPDDSEIVDTLMDFRSRFPDAEVHKITSYDGKKTISLLNKEGKCVLPHLLFRDVDELHACVAHCENPAFRSLLRYFDLREIVRFLKQQYEQFPEQTSEFCQLYFRDIADITMTSLKLFYLEMLKRVDRGTWDCTFDMLCGGTVSRLYLPPVFRRLYSNNSTNSSISSLSDAVAPQRSGVLLTTEDAHTLTDGPTLYLVEDTVKMGRFYIQQTNISAHLLNGLTAKLEHNAQIHTQIDALQKTLDDCMNADDNKTTTTKKKKDPASNDRSITTEENKDEGTIVRLTDAIQSLFDRLHAPRLDSVYIPNSLPHQDKWVPPERTAPISNAFMSDVDAETVREIMMLNNSVTSDMKLLLLMGIGMLIPTNVMVDGGPDMAAYVEIMKRLAQDQRLYLIIASSDYIYGTNYQFCHGYIGKDLGERLTQQKTIQALGRVGRNQIQQEYTIRFRDDVILHRLFSRPTQNMEAMNMCRLFSSDTFTDTNTDV